MRPIITATSLNTFLRIKRYKFTKHLDHYHIIIFDNMLNIIIYLFSPLNSEHVEDFNKFLISFFTVNNVNSIKNLLFCCFYHLIFEIFSSTCKVLFIFFLFPYPKSFILLFNNTQKLKNRNSASPLLFIIITF